MLAEKAANQFRQLVLYSRDDLRAWVKSLLKYGVTAPFTSSLRNTYPSEFLLSIFQSIRDVPSIDAEDKETFQEALKDVLRILFGLWEPTADGLEYYEELLTSIGYLGIDREKDEEMYKKLFAMAEGGCFIGATAVSTDIHLVLLQVLFGVTDDPAQLDIAKDYLEDPRYSAVCFGKAWELDPDRSLDYLQVLLYCSVVDEAFDVTSPLGRYYSQCVRTLAAFMDTLPALVDKLLTPPESDLDLPPNASVWERFQGAMRTIGIDMKFVQPKAEEQDFPWITLALRPFLSIRWFLYWKSPRHSDRLFVDLQLAGRLEIEESRMIFARSRGTAPAKELYKRVEEPVIPLEDAIATAIPMCQFMPGR